MGGEASAQGPRPRQRGRAPGVRACSVKTRLAELRRGDDREMHALSCALLGDPATRGERRAGSGKPTWSSSRARSVLRSSCCSVRARLHQHGDGRSSEMPDVFLSIVGVLSWRSSSSTRLSEESASRGEPRRAARALQRRPRAGRPGLSPAGARVRGLVRGRGGLSTLHVLGSSCGGAIQKSSRLGVPAAADYAIAVLTTPLPRGFLEVAPRRCARPSRPRAVPRRALRPKAPALRWPGSSGRRRPRAASAGRPWR